MATANIHEFSTGITLERQNGQLVSKGFTVGEYMNKTIQSIPQCVERAIANKLFEVSKSSQSSEPTIVGRVVLGKHQGELDWSVVAIVSTGIDNYQRKTDLYRYFLCEGLDSLWKIVDWIEDYRKKYQKWPSYNPADTKTIGQLTRHDCGRQKQQLQGEWHGFLDQRPTPLIFQPEPSYDLATLNAMAEYKAKTKSEPISWVWNVEAVENPAFFLVIQAANQNTYNSLERMRQSQASQPRTALGSGVDMAGVESAIKGLINGGNIKPEWIQTVVQAKQQNQITTEHWEKIFNDLGANSRSISANIVRLLTLRAIILPKTLPDYLQYLDIKKSDQNPNQQQQISLEFQSQIRTYRNSLDSFLSEGAISLAELIGYHRRMDFLPAVAWLFDATQPGLWLKYEASFVSKVKEYFKNAYSTRKEYAPLEKLFREWGYRLYTNLRPVTATPPGQKLLSHSGNITLTERLIANSLELIVQVSFLVIFLIFVGDFQAKLYIFIFAIISGLFRIFLNNKQNYDLAVKIIVGIISFISIIVITFVSHQLIPSAAEWANQKKQETLSESDSPSGENTDSENLPASSEPGKPASPSPNMSTGSLTPPPVSITQEEKEKAISNFEQTREAIKTVVDDLKAQLEQDTKLTIDEQVSKNIVIAALRETLDSNNQFNLQYGAVIEGEVGDDANNQKYRDTWIEAIYVYQQNVPDLKGIGYGYIDPKTPTTTDALKQGITDSPIFQFPTKTKVALEQIVTELEREYTNEQQKTNIVLKLKQVLQVPNLNYAGAMQGTPVEIKKLVEAIKTYQNTNPALTVDGIIDSGGKTYNDLKNQVKPLLTTSGQ